MRNTPNPSYLTICPEHFRTIPSIDGKHFFTKPADPTDDYILDAIDIFPINPNQQYEAPMPKFNWPRGSEVHQQFDKDLAKIQERQAHTTRPLDELAVELLKQETKSTVDFPGFIHHIRSQLAISARVIQDLRMENYTCVIKAKQEPKSKNNIPVAYHGTLSRVQAKNIDSTKPLTTITAVSPLNIPELRSEVGHYLTRQDWLSCSLVCKDWNETFSGFIYSTICISGQRNLSLITLNNKRNLIKSFSITTESPDISFCTLFMPNLRSLAFRVDNSDIAAIHGYITLVNHCKEIRKLDLSITAKLDNSAFWKAVSDLPHLEELIISRYNVMHKRSKDKDLDLSKELQGFWNACSRLKRLEIDNFHYYPGDMRLDGFDWDKPGLAAPSMISNKAFPCLRYLRIYESDASNVSQVLLITRCPNLEVLKWDPDSSEDTATAIGNLCRYFEEGNSPNLKSLEFSRDQEEDTIVADVLRSLDGRALQELDLSNTKFGAGAHEELKRFFPTLRVLNLSRCHFLLSSNALEIILSCPLLEKLAVYQIHAEDLDPARIWPCHKTLCSFNASFNLALKLGSSGRTKKSMTTKKELCEKVYSTLAHLSQLEYLTIDEYRDGEDVWEEDEDYIPLEIDLSKGFGKLAGLKKLRRFQMGATASSVKPRELYWMLANWPKSNSIVNCPYQNDVFRRVLRAKVSCYSS